MYGLENWADVADHVGTKSKEQCIEHYTNVYLKSPCFPLPVRELRQSLFFIDSLIMKIIIFL